MRPTISLCLIVRNEEENLAACLRPVQAVVDEIVVVDTGSTDRTAEIAAELGAKVFSFPWCDDFSAARNEGLRHATGDWILWFDADDRMDEENVARLAALCKGLGPDSPDVYTFQVLSPVAPGLHSGGWVTHGRLFRRASNLHWERRIHEELVPIDRSNPHAKPTIGWSGLMVRHVGYEDPLRRRRKLYRDLRLLQLDYAINPDDPLTLLYLGWGHMEAGHLEQALRFLRRGVARSPVPRKHLALLAQAQARLGQKAAALKTCQQGLTAFPDDPELLYLCGTLLGEKRDLAGAEQVLLRLVNLPPQCYYHLGVEDGLQTEKAPFMLGLLYHEQRRFAEAESQFRFAIRHNPRSSQAWIGLGQLYLATGNWTGFSDALTNLRQCPTGPMLAAVLEARWCIERGDFLKARRLLDEVIASDPQLLWPRLVLSDLAVRVPLDHATAVQIHREILELSPNHPIANERLKLLLASERSAPEMSPVTVGNFGDPVEPVGGRGANVFIACR
jgi:tetratricopeptide (TPR) repeat protein